MTSQDDSNVADALNELRWLRWRIGTFFLRTLNQGLGSFFVFAIFTTIALVSLRALLLGWRDDQAFLNNWMNFKLQPASETTQATVVGLLLAELQRPEFSSRLTCSGSDTRDCRFASELWLMTQRLVDAMEHGAKTAQPPALMTGAGLPDPVFQSIQQLHTTASWDRTDHLDVIRQLSTSRSSISTTAAAPMPLNCGDRKRIAERAELFNLSQPYCSLHASPLTTEFIPQQSADVVYDSDATDARVQRAHLDGEVFELALSGLLQSLQATGNCPAQCEDESAPKVAQAYFLSVDSVIRIWNRSGPVSIDALPTVRLWAARPYFERMLLDMPSDGATATLSYIDFAGSGIVQTQCRLITAPKDAAKSGDTRASTVTYTIAPSARYGVGMVCIDFVLTQKNLEYLVQKVDRSPLAEARLATFAKGLGGEWTVSGVHQSPPWVQKIMRGPLANKIRSNLDSDLSLRRDVITIWEPKETDTEPPAYFIPVAGGDGTLTGVVLRVTAVGLMGARSELVFATIVAVVIALYALLAGARGSKKLAAREAILARLRSLQAGVLETDLDDTIVGANDHAEDLLGTELPSFGLLSTKERSVNFWEILDPCAIWKMFETQKPQGDGGGVPGKRTGKHFFEPIERKDIEKERVAGMTTAYFARRLDNRQAWYRIKAGPIIIANRFRRDPMGLQGTFGIIEEAPESVARRLRTKQALRERDLNSDENINGSA